MGACGGSVRGTADPHRGAAGRDLGGGARARARGGGRGLLRPGRALPAGDPRAVRASSVSSGWSSRCGRSSRRPPWRGSPGTWRPPCAGQSAASGCRCGRRSAAARRRSPSRSSGSGSSDRLEPRRAPTTSPARCVCGGRWRCRRCAARWSEIVRRHEALRTVFRSRDGEPRQVIHAPRPLRLPVHDLSRLPRGGGAGGVAAGARARRGAAALRPGGGPAVPGRTAAPRRAGARAAVEHAPHRRRRLVPGGASTASWGTLYDAFTRGEAVAAGGAAGPVRRLRALAAGVAQRARCWSGSSATGRSSWPARRALLELPTDRPRPAVQSLPGGAAGAGAAGRARAAPGGAGARARGRRRS